MIILLVVFLLPTLALYGFEVIAKHRVVAAWMLGVASVATVAISLAGALRQASLDAAIAWLLPVVGLLIVTLMTCYRWARIAVVAIFTLGAGAWLMAGRSRN